MINLKALLTLGLITSSLFSFTPKAQAGGTYYICNETTWNIDVKVDDELYSIKGDTCYRFTHTENFFFWFHYDSNPYGGRDWTTVTNPSNNYICLYEWDNDTDHHYVPQGFNTCDVEGKTEGELYLVF